MDKNTIIEALISWNFWQKEINIGIPRNRYLSQLRKYLVTDEIITLTGIRRSGKSTILLQLLQELINNGIPKENTLYVNFEDPKFFSFLDLELLDKIWNAYFEYLNPKDKVYLILDEIQKINGWEHWVRAKYDQKAKVKIFVTGSNAELLSTEFSNVLTGRHIELTITPLDFKEFLEFHSIKVENTPLWLLKNKQFLKKLNLDFLQNGGFPKIVLTKDDALRQELLAQYFNDILTKDIVDRHKIKDLSKLKNLALFYGTNFSNKLTFHKVKEIAEFSLSLDSIHRFSSYLENSFIINFVNRFSYSIKNQMRSARKIYFIDNGMRNAVAFKFSQDLGKLLENAVFYHLKNRQKEIYYFQGKQEVDFVIKDGLEIIELVNVCYDLENKETYLREINGLNEAMDYFKLKTGKIITIEDAPSHFEDKNPHIKIIPFYQWALQLD